MYTGSREKTCDYSAMCHGTQGREGEMSKGSGVSVAQPMGWHHLHFETMPLKFREVSGLSEGSLAGQHRAQVQTRLDSLPH